MFARIVLNLCSLILLGHLSGQSSPELILQSNPPGDIADLKITGDGRYLLSIGASNQLNVWDLKTYRLLYNFHQHNQRIYALDITPDGQFAVTGGNDHWIVLFDLDRGTVVKKIDLGEPVCRLAFAGAGTIYVLARSGTLYQVDVASGQKTRKWSRNCSLWSAAFDMERRQILLMPDYMNCRTVKGFELIDLNTGKDISQINYDQGKVFNSRWVKYLPDHQTLIAAEVTFAHQHKPGLGSAQLYIWQARSNDWHRITIPMRVEDVSAYNNNQLLLSGPDEGLAIYDLQRQQITRKVKVIQLNSYWRAYLKPNKNAYFARDGIVVTAMHDINIIDLTEERLLRTFTNNTFSTRDARLTTNGKYWYCSSYNKAMLINTSDGKVAYEFSRFGLGLLSPDGTRRVTATRSGKIHLLDIPGQDTLWSSPKLPGIYVGTSMSEDNRYIAAMEMNGGSKPEIQIWDSEMNRLIDKLPGSDNNGLKPTLSKTARFLGVGTNKDGTFLYQTGENGKYKLIIHYPSQQVTALAFDPLERMAAVATSDGKVICFDLLRQKLRWEIDLKKRNMEPSQLVFSRNHLFIGTFYTGQILRLKASDGQLLQQFTAHANNVRSMSITPDDRFILTNGEDDIIYLHKLEGLQTTLGMMFYTPGDAPDWTKTKDDYVLFTPEGYYWSFGQAYEGIGFRIGKNAYPIEHFDLWYSRPDKVIEALPYPADSLLAPYRRAYRERLNNYEVAEQLNTQQLKLPKLELLAQNLPKTVRERTVPISVRAIAANHPLRRLQVYINDVPIYGSKGISIPSEQSQLYKGELPIELLSGVNKVQISAIDQQELESLRETFYINFEPPQLRRPKLYFLSITVSDFQDEADNLPFAASDLDSLKVLFAKPGHPVYEQVHFEYLLNEQVNEEGLEKLRSILENTHIEDRVILHVATHGLRDLQNRLFLATSQTDFYQPEKKSIPYQQIVDLLDGIPARRKLLILDACRAGEFDDRAYAYSNQRSQPGDVLNNDSKRDWDNPYELARELFTDLRRQNGATILVGAQANEASREGSAWKMSVLMHFFVKALREKEADQPADGRITVSELQQYLITQVSAATKGRQNPAARIYNLSNDWQIW